MPDDEMIECPECGGDGFIDTMKRLQWDGTGVWKRERCPVCDGEGYIEKEEEEENA